MRKIAGLLTGVTTIAMMSACRAADAPSTQSNDSSEPLAALQKQFDLLKTQAQKQIDADQQTIQQLREQLSKREKLLVALADGQKSNRIPSTQPSKENDLPPGSRPEQFNGFTYYIVPLK